MMQFPDTFYIEADTGMFLMRRDGGSLGKVRYTAYANGFLCTVRMNKRLTYTVSLKTDRTYWGVCEFVEKGRALSFDGLRSEISAWIDEQVWDMVSDNDDNDAQPFRTSKGTIAYYAYNTHLDGVPVIFLHGGPGDGAGTTRGRKMHLKHPIYTYDQMGCGRSDRIEDLSSWDQEDYFTELNEFIEGMGFEKVILIGASWGAGLAIGYAVRYGCGRIQLMILPSPFISSERWTSDQMKNMQSLPEGYRREMDAFMNGEGTIENYRHVMSEYYSRFLFAREVNREIAVSAGQSVQNDVFLSMWGPNDLVCEGTMKDFDLIPELNKIDVPVLFMCGDSDEVTIDTINEYVKAVKGSRLSVIPYAGHVIGKDQPTLYMESMKAYLEENGQ